MEEVGQWWPVKLKLLEANYEKSKLKIRQDSLVCKLSIIQVQNAIEQEKVITQKYEKKAVEKRLVVVEEQLAKQENENEDLSRKVEDTLQKSEEWKGKTSELVKKIESLENEKEKETKSKDALFEEISKELDVLKRKEIEWKDKNSKLLSKAHVLVPVDVQQTDGNIITAEKGSSSKTKKHSTAKVVRNRHVTSVLFEKNDKFTKGSNEADSPCEAVIQTSCENSNDQKENLGSKDGNTQIVQDLEDCSDIETSFLKKTEKILRNCRKRSGRNRRVLSDVGCDDVFLENVAPDTSEGKRSPRTKSKSLIVVNDNHLLRSILRKGKRQRRVTFSNELDVRQFDDERKEMKLFNEKEKENIAKHDMVEKTCDVPEVVNPRSVARDVPSVKTRSGVVSQAGLLTDGIYPENGLGEVQKLPREGSNVDSFGCQDHSPICGVSNEKNNCVIPESQRIQQQEMTENISTVTEIDLSVCQEKDPGVDSGYTEEQGTAKVGKGQTRKGIAKGIVSNGDVNRPGGGGARQEHDLNNGCTKIDEKPDGKSKSRRKRKWKDNFSEVNDVASLKPSEESEQKQMKQDNETVERDILSFAECKSNDGEIDRQRQSPKHTEIGNMDSVADVAPFPETGGESEKGRYGEKKRPKRGLRQQISVGSGVLARKRLVKTFVEESCDKQLATGTMEESNKMKGRSKQENKAKAVATRPSRVIGEWNVEKKEESKKIKQRGKMKESSKQENKAEAVATQQFQENEEDGNAKKKEESRTIERGKMKERSKQENKANAVANVQQSQENKENGTAKKKEESRKTMQRGKVKERSKQENKANAVANVQQSQENEEDGNAKKKEESRKPIERGKMKERSKQENEANAVVVQQSQENEEEGNTQSGRIKEGAEQENKANAVATVQQSQENEEDGNAKKKEESRKPIERGKMKERSKQENEANAVVVQQSQENEEEGNAQSGRIKEGTKPENKANAVASVQRFQENEEDGCAKMEGKVRSKLITRSLKRNISVNGDELGEKEEMDGIKKIRKMGERGKMRLRSNQCTETEGSVESENKDDKEKRCVSGVKKTAKKGGKKTSLHGRNRSTNNEESLPNKDRNDLVGGKIVPRLTRSCREMPTIDEEMGHEEEEQMAAIGKSVSMENEPSSDVTKDCGDKRECENGVTAMGNVEQKESERKEETSKEMGHEEEEQMAAIGKSVSMENEPSSDVTKDCGDKRECENGVTAMGNVEQKESERKEETSTKNGRKCVVRNDQSKTEEVFSSSKKTVVEGKRKRLGKRKAKEKVPAVYVGTEDEQEVEVDGELKEVPIRGSGEKMSEFEENQSESNDLILDGEAKEETQGEKGKIKIITRRRGVKCGNVELDDGTKTDILEEDNATGKIPKDNNGLGVLPADTRSKTDEVINAEPVDEDMGEKSEKKTGQILPTSCHEDKNQEQDEKAAKDITDDVGKGTGDKVENGEKEYRKRLRGRKKGDAVNDNSLTENKESLEEASSKVKKDNRKSSVLDSQQTLDAAVEPNGNVNQPAKKRRRTLHSNRESSIMMNRTSGLFQETLPLNSTRSSGGMSHSLSTFMKAFIVPKLKK